MGQLEQRNIKELREQIRQIEWRLRELEGKTEKIAVHAPESWMKEKISKIWGIEDDFIFHKYCGDYIHIVDDGKNNRIVGFNLSEAATEAGYVVITFQDFCHQHGISDKPDYVKSKYTSHIDKALEYDEDNDVKTKDYVGDSITIMKGYWQPATEKEYLRQQYPYPNDDLGVVEDNSEEEPELKLDKDYWKPPEDEFGKGYSDGYYEGACDMQKVINDRALEVFDNVYRSNPGWWADSKTTLWESCKRKAFDAAINGEIKPPTK